MKSVTEKVEYVRAVRITADVNNLLNKVKADIINTESNTITKLSDNDTIRRLCHIYLNKVK